VDHVLPFCTHQCSPLPPPPPLASGDTDPPSQFQQETANTPPLLAMKLPISPFQFPMKTPGEQRLPPGPFRFFLRFAPEIMLKADPFRPSRRNALPLIMISPPYFCEPRWAKQLNSVPSLPLAVSGTTECDPPTLDVAPRPRKRQPFEYALDCYFSPPLSGLVCPPNASASHISDVFFFFFFKPMSNTDRFFRSLLEFPPEIE